MTINTLLSTEEQIKLLRESYKRKGNKSPEFGDSDITSDFPASDILPPVSQAVSDILDTPILPKITILELDINLDEVYSTALNRDLLIQSVSRIEIGIPGLRNPDSTLKLRYLRNSINKGSNGKFLLKFVDDTTKHIYYLDGEKTKDGKITLYYISKHEGKQFYKKYPRPAIIKGITY